MNQESMERLFSAWRWVRDAEAAVAGHLYGEPEDCGDLHDALGELTDAKDALCALVSEHIGDAPEEVEQEIIAASRARFGLDSKDGE